MKKLTAIFFVLSLLLWGSNQTVAAYKDGVSNYSGGFGTYCNVCHAGGSGTVPQITVTGATTVAPSATVSYMLAITSTSPATQTVAGWDIAILDAGVNYAGVISGFDSGVAHLLDDELTHTTPFVNDANGVAIVNFDWTAPNTPGTYTIYFSGNSANNNGANGAGDRAGVGTFEITVAGPTQVGLMEKSSAEVTSRYLLLLILPLLLLTLLSSRKRQAIH